MEAPQTIQMVPPQEQSGTTSTTSTKSTRTIIDPAEADLLKKRETLLAQQAETERELGRQNAAKADAQAASDAELASQQLAKETKLNEISQAAQARENAAQVERDAKVAKRAGAKIEDYFEGHTGRKIAAVLMGALGGLNQNYNRGRNVGLETLDGIVKSHYDQQRQKIEAMDDAIKVAGGKLVDIREWKKARLDDVGASFEAASQTIAAKARAAAAKTGNPEAIARADIEAKKLEAQALNAREEYLKTKRREISTDVTRAVKDVHTEGGGNDRTQADQRDAEAGLASANEALSRIKAAADKGIVLTNEDMGAIQKNERNLKLQKSEVGGLVTGVADTNPLTRKMITLDRFEGLPPEKKELYRDWLLLAATKQKEFGKSDADAEKAVELTVPKSGMDTKAYVKHIGLVEKDLRAGLGTMLTPSQAARTLRPQGGAPAVDAERQAAIDWLKANPKDPRADKIRAKLGMM